MPSHPVVLTQIACPGTLVPWYAPHMCISEDAQSLCCGWAGREPTQEVAFARLRGPNCLPHHRAGAPGLLSSGFASTAGSDQVFPHFCNNGPCFQMRHSFQVLLCPGSSRPLFPPDALFLAHCPVLPPARHNLHLMPTCTEITISSTVSAAGTAAEYRPVHTDTRVHTRAPDVALMAN